MHNNEQLEDLHFEFLKDSIPLSAENKLIVFEDLTY